jgi:putative transposase
MLGFEVSERTVSRWIKQAPRDPEPATRWLSFLRNHQEAIAAMDFFTVPTITFSVLYCFFVISHDRRRILHCNVTKHPTSWWIVQQLREAFPFGSAPRFVIFDLLDHIIAVDERHLKRLLSEYVRYYHEDRTHLGLGKGTPDGRTHAIASGRVLSHVRLGGLYHRYERAA